MSIFGNIKDGRQLETAAIDHLDTWLPTYVAEVERQNGLDPHFISLPRDYTTRNEFDKFPEEQLPLCVVISPGLVDKPSKDGTGRWTAPFGLGVAVVVSADNRANTDALAKWYAAAVRAAVLQHPGLSGFASGTSWEDERFDEMPSSEDRTIAAAQVIFKVSVYDVVQQLAGPVEPPADPYATPPDGWPEAEREDISVTTQWMEDPL